MSGFPDNLFVICDATKTYADFSHGNYPRSKRDLGFEDFLIFSKRPYCRALKKTFLLCAIPPGRFALHYFTTEPGKTKSDG